MTATPVPVLRVARPAIPLTALLLTTLLLAGCAGQTPPPLSAARPALYVDCRGAPSAAPTVILESGAFGSAADWDLVLNDLAKTGRVCAYDRAGVGRSPPRAGPRDAVSIANELMGLLDQIGARRPVILVGHSNGALYIETFAALHPRRVAGLTYVNGVTSDDLDYPLLIDDLTAERRLAGLAALGGDLGLAPAVSEVLAGATGLTGDAARRKREAMDEPDELEVASAEDSAVIAGLTTARKLGGSPAAIPTVVVSGWVHPEAPLSKAWRAAETAVVGRARTGRFIEVPGGDHTSPLARDRAYLVAGVDWLKSVAAKRARP